MTLDHIEYGPLAGGRAQQIVFVMHGRYNNKFGLQHEMEQLAKALPHALFVRPEAPFICDMGERPEQKQWFSMEDWFVRGDQRKSELAPHVALASKMVNELIDQKLAETGLDDSKVAMFGFSQGGIMSLHAGLYRRQKIAGIAAYGCMFVHDNDPQNWQRVPVYLFHGDQDTALNVSEFYEAKDTLARNGFDLTTRMTPGLGHGIESEGLNDGIAFLKRVFRLDGPKPVRTMAPAP